MGLRFRKTISLLPGVRLNISKSGVGVSAGVPGLRGSINTSGRVTGTASIPGTGVSYVKTKKIFGNKKKDSKTKDAKDTKAKSDTKSKAKSKAEKAVEEGVKSAVKKQVKRQINVASLVAIHKLADKVIDWKKVSESPVAPEGYDQRKWAYFYSLAPDVLNGDIDTYLKLIYEVNPLDDLIDYGDNFEFGTDDPDRMEVEFVINDELLEESRQTLTAREFNLLLQDFVCSMALRIARDVFALLPVHHTVVHVVMGDSDIFSVDFVRDSMDKIHFDYIDASNTATQFRHAMEFDEKKGFSPISRL